MGRVRVDPAEHDALVRRVAGGDRDAAADLIAAYAPLVEGQVARVLGRRPHLAGRGAADDLRQEGRLALLEAARRHDPARGNFVGLARIRVRGAVLAAADLASYPIVLPRPALRNLALGCLGRRDSDPRSAREVLRASMAERAPLGDLLDHRGGDGPPDKANLRAAVAALSPADRALAEAHYRVDGRVATYAAVGRRGGPEDARGRPPARPHP
jgi:hypothetical protein